jgi:hypothetical protein
VIRPVSSQLADFLRLALTPASSDLIGCSAVNREAVGSNSTAADVSAVYQINRG